MSTHPKPDPQTLYPFNPCGHFRAPGGGCVGVPVVCHRRPVSGARLVALGQRAAELRDRLLLHPPQPLTQEQLPEAHVTVIDKLASAVSLAQCLNSVIASLLDDKAVLTLEQVVDLATIGSNVALRSRDLQAILMEWMGEWMGMDPL